jgi:hypothetical protein
MRRWGLVVAVGRVEIVVNQQVNVVVSIPLFASTPGTDSFCRPEINQCLLWDWFWTSIPTVIPKLNANYFCYHASIIMPFIHKYRKVIYKL